MLEGQRDGHCLSRCSIAVKRHHDQGNASKGKHLIGVLFTVSEAESIIIMAGSMVACMALER